MNRILRIFSKSIIDDFNNFENIDEYIKKFIDENDEIKNLINSFNFNEIEYNQFIEKLIFYYSFHIDHEFENYDLYDENDKIELFNLLIDENDFINNYDIIEI